MTDGHHGILFISALKAANSKLELSTQAKEQASGDLKTKMTELQTQLDEASKATSKTEQLLEKSKNEVNKLRGQVEEANNKV